MSIDKRTKEYKSSIKQDVGEDIENDNLDKDIKWPPYHGRDGLGRPVFDKKGNVKNKGAYQFFCRGDEKRGYEFLRIRNGGRGIETRLVHRIKTHGKNAMRLARDKKLLEELRSLEVPGAV